MHSSLCYRMSSARASSNKEEEKYAQCWQHTISGLVSEVLSIRETIVWGSRPDHLDHLTKRCNLPLYLICMLKAGHSSKVLEFCRTCPNWALRRAISSFLPGTRKIPSVSWPICVLALWLSMSETLPSVSCSTSSIKQCFGKYFQDEGHVFSFFTIWPFLQWHYLKNDIIIVKWKLWLP